MSWLCWKRKQIHVNCMADLPLSQALQVINCQQNANQMVCLHSHTHTKLKMRRIYNRQLPTRYQWTGHHFKIAFFHWNWICTQKAPPFLNTHTDPCDSQFCFNWSFLINVVVPHSFCSAQSNRLKPFQYGLTCLDSTWHACFDLNWPCVHLRSWAVASSMLTLEVLELCRARDEAHITAFLYQSPYPPVIVEFLSTNTAKANKEWVSWGNTDTLHPHFSIKHSKCDQSHTKMLHWHMSSTNC